MRTVWWEDGYVRLIDQLRLPQVLEICSCRGADEVAEAIRSMKVRGAPAIGVAAAYGVALAAASSPATTFRLCWLIFSRPRRFCVARGRPLSTLPGHLTGSCGEPRQRRWRDVDRIRAAVLAEAETMADEDVAANRAMGPTARTWCRTAPTS